MPIKRTANALLLVIGWLACLLGGSTAWLLIPLGALLLHFFWVSSWLAEGKLVVSVMLAGAAVDSFLLQMGIFDLPGQPRLAPLWMVLPWALVGTTLNHSLAWSGRRWWYASLLGALAAPGIYLSASALTALSLPKGHLISALLLAAIWAVIYPLLHGFAQLYREQYCLRQAR